MDSDRWLYSLSLSAVASSVAGLLVPLYIVQLGGGSAALGLSASLSSLVGAPGAVLAGRYADRTGNRRGVVLVALGAGAVALTLLPFLKTVPAVIVVNAVLAFSLAAISPVVTMLVVANAAESNWNSRIARLNTFQGYGSTAGLVIGTVWTVGVATVLATEVVQESLFALAAAFGVAAAVLGARSLPREAALDVGPRRSSRVATILSRTARNTQDATFSFGTNRVFWASRALSFARLRRLRSELPRPLWLYFLAAFCFFTGFSVFWAPLPLYLKSTLGFDSGGVFALYLVNNLASAVFFERAGVLSGQRDIRVVQGGALALRAGAFVGVAGLGLVGGSALTGGGLGPLAAVGALLFVVGVSWAFIAVTGTAIVSRFAPANARGAILGTYAALSAIAGAVGGLLGGWVASYRFDVAFVLAAALVVTGAALVYGAKRLSEATASPPATPST
ncbi:MFS transporter [Halarchaeum grantii]|uniref:MFS transporter n=1 Tax=Halarchaeum grantii TaxID=1193105 RepID=A0A830FBE1_9EURY|nr:MFS transporter [Halarchaeum grantii]GGL37518.1 MFS transporter [Halarchaeum grantii]